MYLQSMPSLCFLPHNQGIL